MGKANYLVNPDIRIKGVVAYCISEKKDIRYYHFSCAKHFQIRFIPWGMTLKQPEYKFCLECKHRYNCDINNINFIEFWKLNNICPRCDDVGLACFYLYVIWSLRDFVDVEKRRCCYCE